MIKTINELQTWFGRQHADGKRIGLVPTMGALHEGHLSLVRRCAESCDRTVVSIFVNPTQFEPDEDFHRYPRPLETDCDLLRSLGIPPENLVVFVPDVAEMYPKDFDVSVRVGGVTEPFEGISRPTHFTGVATVVLKLFLASGADVAFFGQKDFQQACVIRKLIADLNIPIEIVVCPIVREADGLAMSSRNRYLSESQRNQAVVLSRSLVEARRLIETERCRDLSLVRNAIEQTISTAPDMRVDYAALADPRTLRELEILDPVATPQVVVLLAATIGTTRLIDNTLLDL